MTTTFFEDWSEFQRHFVTISEAVFLFCFTEKLDALPIHVFQKCKTKKYARQMSTGTHRCRGQCMLGDLPLDNDRERLKHEMRGRDAVSASVRKKSLSNIMGKASFL